MEKPENSYAREKTEKCRNWNGPWVITKKISEVLYKIQHKKDLPGVVVHGDNLKEYKGEKKINWFNGGFQEENLPTELPDLEYFKNTDNPDREERENTEPGSTSDTESESESGAELQSGLDAELKLETGAELRSGKDADLESGKDAELRSATKSAIIIEQTHRDLE